MSRAAQIGRIFPLVDACRNRASPTSEYDIPEELLAMIKRFHSGSLMYNNMNSRASREKVFQRTSLTNSSLATRKIVPHWTRCSNGSAPSTANKRSTCSASFFRDTKLTPSETKSLSCDNLTKSRGDLETPRRLEWSGSKGNKCVEVSVS